MTTILSPRNKGHNKIHNALREEWIKAVQADPEAFDILLFRTKVSSNQSSDSVGEVPMFGMIQEDSVSLDYDLPVKQLAVELPAEEHGLSLDDEGEDMPAEILKLKLDTHDVPDRSVIQLLTESSNGETVLTSWYVMRSETIGQASIGAIYHLIPFDGEDSALPSA